ncbi:hypothetical protein [Streptomyces sp. NPDC059015]|uniref:hypothetical protein n=1 Tax=unclassified Streptomyces TaxID=2593676 RepID=UPI0036B0518C
MPAYDVAIPGKVHDMENGSDEELEKFGEQLLDAFHAASDITLHLTMSLTDRTFEAAATVVGPNEIVARGLLVKDLMKAFEVVGVQVMPPGEVNLMMQNAHG